MRVCSNGVLAVVLCVVLAGCSDDGKKAAGRKVDSERVVARNIQCNSDPRRFADATRIADIDNGRGCHVHDAYQVDAISGVELNQRSTFNCSTVTASALWLQKVVQPVAEDELGQRVVKIEVPSSYACRTRNSVRGAKLSEHAHGNAIDVSAFILEDGTRISVLKDWSGGSRAERRFLQQVRRAGCGIFHTVLGPGSDRHHKDHFHFDLQQHRSGGTYCK